MKKFLLVGLLAVLVAGCAMPGTGLVDEESVLIAAERTKRERERTRREELKTKQYQMYYINRGPEAESLAGIATEGGPAAEVAAAGVSSAAPPGAVFAPVTSPGAAPVDATIIAPAKPDPVCGWAPVGVTVCPE